ncbi:MAG: PIN domain-containing protein [Candidatus Eisenbacteria bacterium]|nr:PIN domain-containing protein [Candidatus Eisenbacteria bacterium]
MILVDTSVWVEHLRAGNEHLGVLLLKGQVVTHPFVIGELACGNLRNRGEILRLLAALPRVPVAEHEEVVRFVASRRLYSRDLGWVDIHLLASALLAGCGLWTLDEALKRAVLHLKLPAYH